jgi:hypothetical protein
VTATCVCGQQYTGRDRQALSDRLWAHYAKSHRGEPLPVVTQLPAVDWHTEALRAVRALAAKGEPFVISQVLEYGVPDAPNPRTDWSRIQREAKDLGWIEETGRLGRSVRPTTKSSPCAEWIGTYAARRGAA